MTVKFTEAIRRCMGWCPGRGALPMDTPPDTCMVIDDLHKRGDSLPLHVIAAVLMLLIPLFPALIFTYYSLAIPVLLPSAGVQMAVKALMVGFPVVVIIMYGRMMHDAVGSTLSGAFLYPLFGIYTQCLVFLFVPGLIVTPVVDWLNWNSLAGIAPFVALPGAMGYCASGRTDMSFLIAVVLGFLMIVIVCGIR